MNKQEWVEGLLFSGFRLLAMGLIVAGILGLIFQLAESWYNFDPSYLGAYFMATFLRPLAFLLAGLLLHGLSGRMGRRMARRFAHSRK